MISKNNMVSVVMVMMAMMMALLDWYCPNKNWESHAPTPSILFFTPILILLIILYIFQFIYICFTKLPTQVSHFLFSQKDKGGQPWAHESAIFFFFLRGKIIYLIKKCQLGQQKEKVMEHLLSTQQNSKYKRHVELNYKQPYYLFSLYKSNVIQ